MQQVRQKPTTVARGLGFTTPETTSSRILGPVYTLFPVDNVHAMKYAGNNRNKIKIASGPHEAFKLFSDEAQISNTWTFLLVNQVR